MEDLQTWTWTFEDPDARERDEEGTGDLGHRDRSQWVALLFCDVA